MIWQSSAPSNIALIKYMGKKSANINLPANTSLSYTLENLRSYVELEAQEQLVQDCWEPLQHPDATFIPDLSAEAQVRFVKHLALIKQRFNFTGHFIIRSANNFPAGCGIASSAASFAALTLCAVKALTELTHANELAIAEMADLSRQGSGSSCRSLLGPWVLWQEHNINSIELPYRQLLHHVVVVSQHHKAISSSEAHRRVMSSMLYQGRIERAESRLKLLMDAFKQQQWQNAYNIIWQEFWDMHALFETAEKPFGYMQADTMLVLDYLRHYWEEHNDGPLVTLDAGPNIHILFRVDQGEMAKQIKSKLQERFLVL